MSETQSLRSWLPSFLRNSKSQRDSPNEAGLHETSRLLPESDDASRDDSYGRENSENINNYEEEERPARVKILNEFVLLFKGSIPVILAYTLQMSLQTISVIIVGRKSPEHLATAAFSYMFAMCTGWLIALGGTTALDTLGSSTFTGSKNRHDIGVLLQRAFVVLGLFYVPVAILWIFSEPVFKLLGQDDRLSRDSAKFLRCLVPGGLGYIYFECMKKYLQVQGEKTHGSDLKMLTSLRNHATGNIHSFNYFPFKRCPQFPFCVWVEDGLDRRSHCYRNLLLAFFSADGWIRMVF